MVHDSPQLAKVKIYNMNLVLINLQIMKVDTFVFKRQTKPTAKYYLLPVWGLARVFDIRLAECVLPIFNIFFC